MEKSSGKSIFRIDSNVLHRFYEATTEGQKREILRPVSVAILWDRGELSLDGFSRADDKIWLQICTKINTKLNSQDWIDMTTSKIKALDVEEDLKKSILDAQRMWKLAERNRTIVRDYVEGKKQLALQQR
jgi:hypothetical protein